MYNRNRFISMGFNTYVELTPEEAKAKYDEIITEWEMFLDQNDPNLRLDKDYFVHDRNLFEVIRRCDKRILYFYIFHELVDECEYKELAVKCFWIITLKPFMVVNTKSKIYNCPNEMFSLFLIFSAINKVYNRVFPNSEFKYPSADRIKDILYDFKYCSMSRESMISFIETLADTYGVGISYILKSLKDEN